jgi:hypothetical protein
MRGEEYDEHYSPFSRRNMYSAPAVERTDAEGDPDLPRYGESLLLVNRIKLRIR